MDLASVWAELGLSYEFYLLFSFVVYGINILYISYSTIIIIIIV